MSKDPLRYEGKISTIFNRPDRYPPTLAFYLEKPDDYCQELANKIITPLIFAARGNRTAIQTLEKAFFMAILLNSEDVDLAAIAQELELREDDLMTTLINYGFRVRREKRCSKTKNPFLGRN